MAQQPLNSDFDAADMWLAALAASGRSPRTLAIYGYAVRQLRAWRTAETPIETMTRIEAMAFVRHLTDTFQPVGVRTRIKALRAMYNWLVAEGEAPANPFARVTITVPDEAQPILSDELLDTILASAKRSRRDLAIITILADTGCRKGEIAAVRYEDVDLGSGTIRFPVSKTRARTVPLTDRAVTAVAKWLRYRPVAQAKGVRSASLWDVEDPYDLIKHVVARHSGGKATPHQFRRRFAVQWMLKGGSETGLMRVAGWRSRTMIQTYTAASADVLADAEFRRLLG